MMTGVEVARNRESVKAEFRRHLYRKAAHLPVVSEPEKQEESVSAGGGKAGVVRV